MRILLVPVLLLLAACGSSNPAPGDSGDGPTVPVGEYVVDGLPAPFDEGDRVGISFTEDGLGFTTGCNGHLSEGATWDDGVLRVPGFGATEMGCPGDGNEEDAWLAELLADAPEITVDGTDVRLATAEEELWLVPADEVAPAPVADRPLAGTRWALTGIEERDGDSTGVLVVPPRVEAWVEVGAGRLDFRAGCNAGGGPVEVVGDRLRLGEVAIQLVGCQGVEAEVERASVPVLMADVLTWQVSGTELRLTRGGTTLVYRGRPSR